MDSDSDNEDILEACEQAEALSEHANNGADDEEDDEDKFLEQHLIHRSKPTYDIIQPIINNTPLT